MVSYSSRRNLLKACVTWFLKYLFLLVIVIISLFPLIWVAMSSFKTNNEILSNALDLPSGISFEGYKNAFKIIGDLTFEAFGYRITMPKFGMFFLNSLYISLGSIVVNVLLVSMSSYIIARYHFKLKNVIVTMFSMSLLIPATSMIHSIYILVNRIGLNDTRMGLILVYSALQLPMTLFIMRSYFLGIPTSLEEAAYIDGAGFLTTFFKIIMPIAKPGLATAAVLQFLTSWNEFLFALTLTTKESVRTLPLSLNYFLSLFSFNYTSLFAAITMMILPSIVAYTLLQEQVVSSLTAGSVKG